MFPSPCACRSAVAAAHEAIEIVTVSRMCRIRRDRSNPCTISRLVSAPHDIEASSTLYAPFSLPDAVASGSRLQGGAALIEWDGAHHIIRNLFCPDGSTSHQWSILDAASVSPSVRFCESAKVAKCFTVLLIDLRVRVVVDCVAGLLMC